MLYGATVWDPTLIFAQIVALQSLFYLSLGLWQALFLGPYVGRLTVAHVLSWRAFSFHTYTGWISIVASLLNSILGAVFLLWLVERAKKCLDFASTCYFWHLVFCWRYSGFPARFEWWATNVTCLVITSLFGEWLCLRREMQEIPLNTLRGRGANSSGAGTSSGGVAAATSMLIEIPSSGTPSKTLPKAALPQAPLGTAAV